MNDLMFNIRDIDRFLRFQHICDKDRCILFYLRSYMASKRCEISTFIKDNGVDLFL